MCPAPRTPRRSSQPCYYGPFKVLWSVTPVTYKLELPENITIHPVVHAKYLKEYVDGAETFPTGQSTPRYHLLTSSKARSTSTFKHSEATKEKVTNSASS